MKRLLLLLGLLSSLSWGQAFYQFPSPVPGTIFRVCPVGTANPCPTPVPIYSDVGLSSLITQPVLVGPDGNYGFYVQPGQYAIQISQPNPSVYLISLGGGAGVGTSVNGRAYSSLYPQSTMVDRINAAVADCMIGANGCVSHIVDSTGEAVVQSFAGTQGIVLGDGNSTHTVTWIHPTRCQWSFNLSGGTGSAIKQFGYTRIDASSPHLGAGCEIINASGTNGMSEVYLNNGSGGLCYFRAAGLTLESKNVATASNAVMRIPAGCDTTTYEDIEVLSYVSGVAGILIGNTGGPCCSITFNRVTINNNYTGGIPLDIEGNGSGITNGVYFLDSSIDHPAAGQPNIKIANTSTTIPLVVGFTGTYEEGNNADTTTVFNQLTGLMQVFFNGIEAKSQTASSTAPIFSLNGTQAMSFSVRDLSTPLNFTQPIVGVQNNITSSTCGSPPCNFSVDAKGNMVQYTTNSAFFDGISTKSQTFLNVTGSTQCLHVNTNGVLSGTGSDCGTGGTTLAMIDAFCGGVVGGGSGTAYILAPAIQANSTGCSQTAVQEVPMAYAATASHMFVTAAVAGAVAGSGVVAIFKNGVATAITCTLGTGLTCSDITHTAAFVAGDTWSVRVTTGQASDTTQGVKVGFQYQ